MLAPPAERMRGVDFTGLSLRSLDENFFLPGLELLDERFGDQPLLQARLRQTVASVLFDLGRLELAMKPQEQAMEARRRLLGDEHPDIALSYNNIGVVHLQNGDVAAALERLERSLDMRTKILGPDHPDTRKTRMRVMRTRKRLSVPGDIQVDMDGV